MASTETGLGPIVPVGIKAVVGSISSTYASGTWSFTLPSQSYSVVNAVYSVLSSAGQDKRPLITRVGALVTIATGTDAIAAGDVATVLYTLN